MLEKVDVLSEIASSLSHESLLVGDACVLCLDTSSDDSGDEDALGVQQRNRVSGY